MKDFFHRPVNVSEKEDKNEPRIIALAREITTVLKKNLRVPK